jgi:MFS family permease
MRRLLLLVAALVFVDTMLYAALTPLLPHFAHTLHLSKAGAGVLVAAYAAGAPSADCRAESPPLGSARARRPRRPDADGTRESRLCVRARLLAALRRALPAGCGSAFTWAGAFAWLLAAARASAADR